MARLVVESVTGDPPSVGSTAGKGGAWIVPEGFVGGPAASKGDRPPAPARWYI